MNQPYSPLNHFIQHYTEHQAEQMAGENQDESTTTTTTTADRVEAVTNDALKDDLINVKSINDLERAKEDDGRTLIGKRYLCKGQGLLFPAPSGIGKSTFTLQTLMYAATGNEAPWMPFATGKPIKTLYVQAENDDADMAEMRDGLYEAIQPSKQDVKLIGENLLVLSESRLTGIKLVDFLDGAVREYQPAILVLDPVFSYLGGNASEQAAVSMFLRNMLNPMMIDHDIAIWLVHHTNKPATGMEKRNWEGHDLAYLGAGSAEWTNWARSTLTIRQIGIDGTYELRAQKRGMRLGWTDPEGNRVVHRYIRHGESNRHVWQEADWDWVQQQLDGGKKGRPEVEVDTARMIVDKEYPFASKEGAVQRIMAIYGIKSPKTARRIREENMTLKDGKYEVK